MERFGGGEPLHGLFDQEGGDAARASLRIGLRVNNQRIGVRPIGDPVFGTIQAVMIVALFGAQLHRHHIRTGRCLRHGERTDMLTGDQAGQIFLLLLGSPIQVDLVDAEI